MSFLDVFKGKQYKAELEKIKETFTPEMNEAADAIKARDDALQELERINEQINKAHLQLDDIEDQITQKSADLVQMDEEILFQEFGLYKPQYKFTTSERYKSELDYIRTRQKWLIQDKQAAHYATNWTVNNSVAKGKKMINDTVKLLLRAFNSECDYIIDRVKFSNYESSKKRITTARDTISRLGTVMQIYITDVYYQLKIEELTLAYEYQIMKQKEKEEQAELRAQAREEAKLKKEIEEALRNLKKERKHYNNALDQVNKKLEASPTDSDLLDKRDDIKLRLLEIDRAEQEVDYRAANMRAGYVYVISNIGSFGENVYKIGMTRRLDPNERVYELGDASVPFRFDVHAMIFSEDAPKLEAALHKAFEDRKINMVNGRREFFCVTLDEIKEVVQKNYEKTAEFIDLPDAEQYRISEKMRSTIN